MLLPNFPHFALVLVIFRYPLYVNASKYLEFANTRGLKSILKSRDEKNSNMNESPVRALRRHAKIFAFDTFPSG